MESDLQYAYNTRVTIGFVSILNLNFFHFRHFTCLLLKTYKREVHFEIQLVKVHKKNRFYENSVFNLTES